MENFKKFDESIKLNISVGDTLLGGKFKNKKIVVKKLSTNERGEPLVNGKPLLKYRMVAKGSQSLVKFTEQYKQITESIEEVLKYEKL